MFSHSIKKLFRKDMLLPIIVVAIVKELGHSHVPRIRYHLLKSKCLIFNIFSLKLQ